MNKIFISLVFIIASGSCFAGNFSNKARLDSIIENGFYKIVLKPDIISYLKTDYSDLRLYDSKNKEVPYMLFEENFKTQSTFFNHYPIIENALTGDSKYTRLVLQNPGKQIRNEIYLVMRNTEIEKEIILKGSDDKKNWYTITKNYPDKLPINSNDTSETKVLRFPKSNYAWFELSFKNHKHDLIQILQASYIDEKVFNGAFTLLPNPKIIQKEKDKKSLVYIIFNKPNNINRLQFDITGPALYLRNCKLSYLVKEGKYYTSFNSSVISSENPTVFEFQTIKADTLLIEIENNDNPPLKIDKIAAYQLNVYIIANLSANEDYTLYFGDQNLNAPNYDLKFFTSRVPNDVKILGLKETEYIAKMKAGKESGVPIYFNKYVLWTVISLVALLLVFLTVKVTKEMK